MLPQLAVDPPTDVRWFSDRACVRWHDGVGSVFVGGSLVGEFAAGDRVTRYLIVVGLAEDPRVHLGKLAAAFGITYETLRLVRRLRDAEGLEALLARKWGGREDKLTPAQRRRIEKLFAKGLTVSEVHKEVGDKFGVGRTTVWTARPASSDDASSAEACAAQPELPAIAEPPGRVANDDARASGAAASDVPVRSPIGSADEDRGAEIEIGKRDPESGRFVQDVGSWLLIATVAALGLHGAAEEFREERIERDALRMAFDAVIAALAIGEKCVEGVRRLATSTGAALLRAAQSPAATWVRRVLGRFAAETGAARLHLRMAGNYVAELSRENESKRPIVFYVDNHLRPYTGKEVIRRGWRMQDKRVVPGSTDFYVHDEDGRPVLRIHDAANGSLTSVLTQIARLLRLALGPEPAILLAFDRAGAFPSQLVELRDEKFEFVTYERRPYPLLAESAFDTTATIDGERYALHDAKTNLGKGRGRLRRISVRTPEGRQINVIANSTLTAGELLAIVTGRWVQENGFKRSVERWGSNQLDARSTKPYAPDDVIPNPARRRLDRAMRIAKVREGDARRELARLDADHPRRERWEQEIVEAMEQQLEIETLLPKTPKRAAVRDTELAGALVRHETEYKLLIDTIRIACANAESDLAGDLAPLLSRPREAKRVLANLFAAPGRVRVGARTIAVDLLPAGTRTELAASAQFCETINRRKLSLPGDTKGRRLRFRVASRKLTA